MANDKSSVFILKVASSAPKKELIKNSNILKKYFNRVFPRIKSTHQSELTSEIVDDVEATYKDSLYGLVALVILMSASFSSTLLPVHNVLINPEYWYEIVFSSCSTPFFIACCGTIGAEAVMNPFKKGKLPVIIDLFVTYKIAETLGYSIVHLIWTGYLEYFEPFPYRFSLVHKICFVALLLRFKYLIPHHGHMDQIIRSKIKWYACWGLWLLLMGIQLLFYLRLFDLIPRNMHWLIALIAPLSKEVNDRVTDILIVKAALPENLIEAKFMTKITNNLFYSLWLALSITKASRATEFILLGVNFLIDMALCFKIIRFDKKVFPFDRKEESIQASKKLAITELILNEIIEVMVPLALIGSFLAAYFGPNKEIIGLVGCTVWNFEKIEDLYSFIMPVIEMALLDSGSVILAGCLLRKFCGINIFQEYCKAIKKYWMHLAFHGGSLLSTVSLIGINSKVYFYLSFFT